MFFFWCSKFFFLLNFVRCKLKFIAFYYESESLLPLGSVSRKFGFKLYPVENSTENLLENNFGQYAEVMRAVSYCNSFFLQ